MKNRMQYQWESKIRSTSWTDDQQGEKLNHQAPFILYLPCSNFFLNIGIWVLWPEITFSENTFTS